VDPANESLKPWFQHPLGGLARSTWLRCPEGPITDADYVVALYDREIRYLDDGIGELLSALDELGLSENTLVLFVADHGECMAEHGVFFNHYGLYDCNIRVPLIARMPGRLSRGDRVSQVIQMHDMAPTILEAAGLPADPAMDGRSFWPLLNGRDGHRGYERVVSVECSWQAKWSLRTDTHKFILSREPDPYGNPLQELYDLKADPAEERNIAEEAPGIARAMEAELEAWIAERLRALGKEDDPLRIEGISLGKAWPPGT